MSSENYCICCLERQMPLVSLTKCVHASYLSNFDLSIGCGQNLVCIECHNILKKIEQFRRTVENSSHVLSTQGNKLQQNQLKPKHKSLHQTPIEITDLTVPEITSTNAEKTPELEIKLEIKEYFTDASDIPLCEIKKEESSSIKNKKVVKKRKKKVLSKVKGVAKQKVLKPTQISKYEGKIRTVMLTDEELNEERLKEGNSPGYLKLPYKCESCIMGFDYEYTLQAHNDRKHPEQGTGTFSCDICKSVLSSGGSYKDHMRRHYRRFECCECSKRYVHQLTTVKHYTESHAALATTTYSCQQCDFTTESHRVYRYHLEKHRGKHQCAECGNTFVNSSGLKAHLYTIHGNSGRVFSCAPCGKLYRARSGLAQHRAACHAARPDYCADCDAHFKSRHNLLLHLNTARRHRQPGDERFVCESCGARFVSRTLLTQHVNWKHLRNTKHKCGKCDNKSFRSKGDLAKHIDRVHLKTPLPRNKMCDYCGRGFTSIAILSAHIRTHTGERPLQCAHCAATFAHPAARYTHTKLLHNTRTHQ